MDDYMNGRRVSSPQLRPESQFKFAEGIYLLLSRWNALQMAIKNEWGGRDSRQKSEQLAADLFSWLSQSKVAPTTEDLEHMLDERMILSFNTEVEDGSIEEVAEALMIMHEECLQGNYESVEKLRIPKPNYRAEVVSQHRQVVKEYDTVTLYNEASIVVVDNGSGPQRATSKDK